MILVNKSGMYAIYNGKEYRCGTIDGGKGIKLYSDIPLESFTEFFGTYSKLVKREECSRVYKKTLCFRYNNDSFLIREEKDNKVLLETGPRSYDLLDLGFVRVLHDTFQKWVSLDEGERYWAIMEY